MMSLGELQISFPLFFVPKIYLMTSYLEFDKVDQDEVFYYKDTLHFFLEWPKYYPYQKSYLRLVAL
jgi:hypothetical protein